MVVSLYVCEIPADVTKSEIESLFSEIEGYIETRTKEANDKRTIAFIDYQNTNDARCARDTLQGFKFTDKDKGLIIKISDNTKNGISQGNNRPQLPLPPPQKKVPMPSSSSSGNPHYRKSGGDNDRAMRRKRDRSRSRSRSKSYSNDSSEHSYYNRRRSDHNAERSSSPRPRGNHYYGESYDSNVNQSNAHIKDDLDKFDEYFQYSKSQGKVATNIVYIEGMPYGTTEREVSHIFRPFPGFQSVRLITRVKDGEKTLLCFVDFENVIQSTVCINTLQGYRFDKTDLVGLHFSYGISKYKK